MHFRISNHINPSRHPPRPRPTYKPTATQTTNLEAKNIPPRITRPYSRPSTTRAIPITNCDLCKRALSAVTGFPNRPAHRYFLETLANLCELSLPHSRLSTSAFPDPALKFNATKLQTQSPSRKLPASDADTVFRALLLR